MKDWSTTDMNGGPWQGLPQSEDFQLGIEQGLEVAIALAMDAFRHSRIEARHFMGQWEPQMATNINACTKMNKLGYAVWTDATTAGCLITLLEPHISTRTFELELQELDDAYEMLSSWDLYQSFGWEVK